MHEDGYFIGKYRGQFCAKLWLGGQRVSRIAIGTDQQAEAERHVKALGFSVRTSQ
jgi:hypothetical protein